MDVKVLSAPVSKRYERLPHFCPDVNSVSICNVRSTPLSVTFVAQTESLNVVQLLFIRLGKFDKCFPPHHYRDIDYASQSLQLWLASTRASLLKAIFQCYFFVKSLVAARSYVACSLRSFAGKDCSNNRRDFRYLLLIVWYTTVSRHHSLFPGIGLRLYYIYMIPCS